MEADEEWGLSDWSECILNYLYSELQRRYDQIRYCLNFFERTTEEVDTKCITFK